MPQHCIPTTVASKATSRLKSSTGPILRHTVIEEARSNILEHSKSTPMCTGASVTAFLFAQLKDNGDSESTGKEDCRPMEDEYPTPGELPRWG